MNASVFKVALSTEHCEQGIILRENVQYTYYIQHNYEYMSFAPRKSFRGCHQYEYIFGWKGAKKDRNSSKADSMDRIKKLHIMQKSRIESPQRSVHSHQLCITAIDMLRHGHVVSTFQAIDKRHPIGWERETSRPNQMPTWSKPGKGKENKIIL